MAIRARVNNIPGGQSTPGGIDINGDDIERLTLNDVPFAVKKGKPFYYVSSKYDNALMMSPQLSSGGGLVLADNGVLGANAYTTYVNDNSDYGNVKSLTYNLTTKTWTSSAELRIGTNIYPSAILFRPDFSGVIVFTTPRVQTSSVASYYYRISNTGVWSNRVNMGNFSGGVYTGGLSPDGVFVAFVVATLSQSGVFRVHRFVNNNYNTSCTITPSLTGVMLNSVKSYKTPEGLTRFIISVYEPGWTDGPAPTGKGGIYMYTQRTSATSYTFYQMGNRGFNPAITPPAWSIGIGGLATSGPTTLFVSKDGDYLIFPTAVAGYFNHMVGKNQIPLREEYKEQRLMIYKWVSESSNIDGGYYDKYDMEIPLSGIEIVNIRFLDDNEDVLVVEGRYIETFFIKVDLENKTYKLLYAVTGIHSADAVSGPQTGKSVDKVPNLGNYASNTVNSGIFVGEAQGFDQKQWIRYFNFTSYMAWRFSYVGLSEDGYRENYLYSRDETIGGNRVVGSEDYMYMPLADAEANQPVEVLKIPIASDTYPTLP